MIPRHPHPVSPVERVLIDHHIAEKGVIFVATGLSSMDVPRENAIASWGGHRNGQPPALRMKLARRRQQYRKLVDEGKSYREIAKIIGVKVDSVYNAVRRMRLKIKPKFYEPRDG